MTCLLYVTQQSGDRSLVISAYTDLGRACHQYGDTRTVAVFQFRVSIDIDCMVGNPFRVETVPEYIAGCTPRSRIQEQFDIIHLPV